MALITISEFQILSGKLTTVKQPFKCDDLSSWGPGTSWREKITRKATESVPSAAPLLPVQQELIGVMAGIEHADEACHAAYAAVALASYKSLLSSLPHFGLPCLYNYFPSTLHL